MLRYVLIILACFTLPVRAEIAIQEVTSDGGLQGWLVEEHSLPFVALEISFQGGTTLDRPGKEGAVDLMVSLLEEGAGDLDARGFAMATESLAASFGFRAHRDSISVSAQFLTENRDEAISLLRAALTSPRFDPDDIERVRAQLLSSIRSRATDPGEILASAWDAKIFGDHPYGLNQGGSEETVAALSREDLLQAYQDTMTLDRIYVGAVGDITADELSALLDDLFADLPKTGAAFPDRAELGYDASQTVIPYDSPQSIVRFGHQGMRRDDPDFFPAFLISEIIGGLGSDGRLMYEVREKRGLTYGIGAYLYELDYAEGFVGQFSSQNANIPEAIDVVRAEWARMARDGVTEEELNRAKTYLTGSYPLRFDGNGTIANILVGMQMEGLPIDYITTRNDKVNAVTLEEANRVAKQLLRPEELTFMIVGSPEGLLEQPVAN